jgi:hypothetical protein
MNEWQDLSRFNPEVILEILRHKGLISEKVHRIIDTREAAEDWINNHYDSWLKARLALKA